MSKTQDNQPEASAAQQWIWLFVAQCAQTAASACLLFSAVNDGDYSFRWNPLGRLWLYLFIPVPLLVPVFTAITSRWSARAVLLFCGAANIAVLAAFGSSFPIRFRDGIWYLGLPLLGLVTLIFYTVRDSVLADAAEHARTPARGVALNIGLGTLGFFLGLVCERATENYLQHLHQLLGGTLQGSLQRLSEGLRDLQVDPIVLFAGAFYCVFLAAVDRIHLAAASECRSLAHALTLFPRHSWLILRQGPARAALCGRILVFALVVAAASALIGDFHRAIMSGRASMLTIMATLVGLPLGCLIALVQPHVRRARGFVPIAASGVFVTYCLSHDAWGVIPAFIAYGALSALILVPLWATYLTLIPLRTRAIGVAVANGITYLLGGLIGLACYYVTQGWLAGSHWSVWIAAGLFFCGAALAWMIYFREALEWLVEIVIWPLYRIRAFGPGKDFVPLSGPLLVIADHTSWFDPIWIAKVFPRRIRPMMTSRFYDLPFLRWLMVRVVGAIRVQASGFRREAPELDQAIALLDQGECVLMFPEGRMRRSADQTLRQFGQGVWHILDKRPATPVVVCWIEGGWGSYFSYAGGPPTKNKRLDFWRQIKIAIQAPLVVEPELLKDQRATRRYLMRVCLDARRHLGLEPLEKVELLRDDVEMASDAKEND